MKVEVYPSSITGKAIAPGSKSVAQRIVACALLARGESVIYDYPDGNDCKAALDICQALGAVVSIKGNQVSIKGGFPNAFLSGIRNPKNEIQCGESGLSSRMFIPIAALYDQAITINGEGSLLNRTFADHLSSLPKLDVECTANDDKLPFTVHGPLKNGAIEIDAQKSSQFLTGLLIALSRASGESHITVRNLKSKPYVLMTLQVLKRFGANISSDDFSSYHISPSLFQPQKIRVPGDWSGAAFLLVAGALCAEEGLTIENVQSEFQQADSAILDVLKLAGVELKQEENSVTVIASEIKAFEFDANDCPDLFPPLAALAAFANGVSTIHGVKRLIHKESNRGKTIQQEFAKANIRIIIRDDEMKIYPAPVRRAIINSHNDHRIAMAAAILGLAGGRMTIKGAECVAKSFPNFFDVLQSLNGKIQGHQSPND